MEFLLIAKDGDDAEALERRLKARDAHIAYSDEAVKRGEQLVAAALLDDKGDMRGSAVVVDFENIEALKKWLEVEPYMTGNVWKDLDIIPCRVGPSFDHVKMRSA